jgi:NAD(P) transhydrogenase
MHLSGYQYQGIYGMSYRVKEKITVADLSFRVQQVIKTEVDVTTAQLSRIDLLGMVPVLMQAPPTTSRFSTSATRLPSFAP